MVKKFFGLLFMCGPILAIFTGLFMVKPKETLIAFAVVAIIALSFCFGLWLWEG